MTLRSKSWKTNLKKIFTDIDLTKLIKPHLQLKFLDTKLTGTKTIMGKYTETNASFVWLYSIPMVRTIDIHAAMSIASLALPKTTSPLKSTSAASVENNSLPSIPSK